MSNDRHMLSTSIGKKLVMSLTGLFLCLFLIIHLVGNLQLLYSDNGKSFNEYAHFMTTFTPIKIVSYLLYASIILHAVYALVLTAKNRKARPIGYGAFNGAANSTWSSRNMGLLGTVLLVFIVTHMNNFWWKFHNDQLPYIEYRTDLATQQTTFRELPASEFAGFAKYVDNGVEIVQAKDLQRQVDFTFAEWYWVALYVISMIALSFHLIHGFKSAFHTLGFAHKKYVPIVRFLGIWVFGVAIPAGFAVMPLYSFFVK